MARNRITRRDLESLVGRLNTITGHPAEPYTLQDGTYRPNPGTFLLSGAYGGWALHQMANEGTGERDVLYSGHIPARELYAQMQSYVHGLLDASSTTEEV